MNPEELAADTGKVSLWNEGNFKCLRLHEAQEMINRGKFATFKFFDDEMSYGFEIWEGGITILYDEGVSKYSKEEREEVDKMKKFVDKFLRFKPPFKIVGNATLEKKKSNPISNTKNQQELIAILRLYEFIVKRYNDEHGLSTRNVEEDDWRGL